MTMFHTMQGCYQPFFNTDVTTGLNHYLGHGVSDASYLLDGETNFRKYCASTRPSYAKEIGPEWNYVETIFTLKQCTTVAHGACRVWGYADNGPAELICDISISAGCAHVDNTVNFYAAKITFLSSPHIGDITALDCAEITAKIAKLRFDVAGYRWLLYDPYELTIGGGADGSGFFNAWIRPY